MVASIALWIGGALIGLSGLMLAGWGAFRRRGPARGCPRCGYDMEGAPSLQCPECGRTAKSEARLRARRTRWRWVGLGLVVVLIGAFVGGQGEAIRRPNGWWSMMPRQGVVIGYYLTGAADATTELSTRLTPQFAAVITLPRTTPSDELSSWERRLVLSRAVNSLALPISPRVTPANLGFIFFDIAKDRDAAQPVYEKLLRSKDPVNHERAMWLHRNGEVGAAPNTPRAISAVEAFASDVSSAWRDDGYGALASVKPFQAERIEAATRSCLSQPHFLGGYGGWEEDMLLIAANAGADATPYLTKMLGDEDPKARAAAALAIVVIGPPAADASEALERVRRDDPVAEVRWNARHALLAIHGGEDQ